jgi:hypothetical protein
MKTDRSSASTGWTCYVSRVAHWSAENKPDLEAKLAIPEIPFVDAMQRRRLSPLAKASLAVMSEAAEGAECYQTVYASRHGEIERTTSLLNQLALGETVSPMGFSLAVLNATAGVYSISKEQRSPCTAVSAGSNTFAMGWLEAAMQAGSTRRPVLFAYADAPPPAVYGDEAQTAGALHAIAMLMHAQAGDGRVGLQCDWTQAPGDISDAPQSSAFVQGWTHRQDGSWSDGYQCWSWRFL